MTRRLQYSDFVVLAHNVAGLHQLRVEYDESCSEKIFNTEVL